MTRWYRRYDGTVSDPKFAEAAMIAECSRSVIIATWDAILESAAADQNGGHFRVTPRNVAATLQEQPATIERVFAALAELKMIENGVVSAWSRRQYQSDSSTERSRRHREGKKNNNKINGDAVEERQQPDATLQGRCETPPETESDTDKIDDDARARTTNGLQEKLVEAAGPCLVNVAAAPGLLNLGTPLWWLDQGCDLERDVLPTLTEVGRRSKPGSVRSWEYFNLPIAAAKGRRERKLPEVTAEMVRSVAPKSGQPKVMDLLRQRYAEGANAAG